MKSVQPGNSKPRTTRRQAIWSKAILTLLATVLASATAAAAPPPATIDLGPIQGGAPLIAVDVFDNIDIATLNAGTISFTQSLDNGNSFSPPVAVATSPTFAGLQMALDSFGDIFLLWEDWQAQQAFVSVSFDGVSFSAPTMLKAGAACGLGPCTTDPGVYPQLSVTPCGIINVAFYGSVSDPRIDVFSAQSVDWGATFTTFSVTPPASVLVNRLINVAGPQNQEYLVWSSPNGQLYFSGSLDGGQTFSTPVNISNDPDARSVGPYAFVDSSGNLDVTWRKGSTSTDPRNKLMFTTSADQGSTFSIPILVLATSEFVIPSQEQIVVDSNGAIDIAVDGSGAGGIGTVLFTRSTDGGATFSTPLSFGEGRFPAVAIDACGQINLAWSTDAVPADIFLLSSADGETFSAPANFTMNPAGQNSFVPHLATDSQRNTFAIWEQVLSPGVTHAFFAVAGTCGL